MLYACCAGFVVALQVLEYEVCVAVDDRNADIFVILVLQRYSMSTFTGQASMNYRIRILAKL